MRTRTPTETLQVVRYENLIPGARLSSPLSARIAWRMDPDAPSTAAMEPYDAHTICSSAARLDGIRTLLAQDGSAVAGNVASTLTILSPAWRHEQLQFVAFCIDRLGRIACRLVQANKLRKPEGEDSKLYGIMTCEALCFAALLGLSGHKVSEQTSPYPLYYPVGQIVEAMQRYPEIRQNEWRFLYIYTAREPELREAIIQRHLSTGRSAAWCYDQIRRKKNNGSKF